MSFNRNDDKTYRIRKRKKGLSVFITVSLVSVVALLLSALLLGGVFSSFFADVFAPQDAGSISSVETVTENASILDEGKKEESSSIAKVESGVSSSIAQTETDSFEVPKKDNNASSKRTSSPSKTSSKVSVNLGGSSSSILPYDVYAEAENWTYKVDKSKPVPLQPAVDNDFFSDVMFVGDSITTGIDLYGIVNNAPVVAYTGINTNTVLTRQVIKTSSGKVTFLQAMKKYKPKHIYIMMGINGIAFQSKDNLINGYGKFIDEVKKQHPDAVIYLQSILPVTAKKQRNDSRFANSKIDNYNKAIAKLAKKKGVYYLNVAEAFKDNNGCMPNAASPNDGIHFGPSYYRRWIEYLKRHTVYTGKIPDVSSSDEEEPSSSKASSDKVSSVDISSKISSVESSPKTSSENTSSKREESSSSEIVSSAESSSRKTVLRD